MWSGCSGWGDTVGYSLRPLLERQRQETRLPGVVVPPLLVWIKELHDLGGADLSRGTRPNTQAWNEFAQLLTKSGLWCRAGALATHPSSQDLLGARLSQGLQPRDPSLHRCPCPSPRDPEAALSAPRSTSGGASTRSLLPSTRPPCFRMLMTPSSSRSASETMATSLTPPACRWPPPPSTAGRSSMVRPEAACLAEGPELRVGAEP